MRRVAAVVCLAGFGALTKHEFIEADDFLGDVSITVAAESEDPSQPPTDAQLEKFTGHLLPTWSKLAPHYGFEVCGVS